MKGMICLDIDGTMTADPYHIPKEVISYLSDLFDQGWRFVLITGRMYSFAWKVVKEIPFPYFLALQNGADLLLMPQKQLVVRQYIPSSFTLHLEEIGRGCKEDFLIYRGVDLGDSCYVRSSRFSPKMRLHLDKVRTLSEVPWEEVEEFSFAEGEEFSLIKGFGTKEEMKKLCYLLSSRQDVSASMTKDPLAEDVYLCLMTAPQATKGRIVHFLRQLLQEETLFIGAGDDYNDLPLLQEVDVRIAMKNSPQALLDLADVVAEPASALGIINALQEVIRRGTV